MSGLDPEGALDGRNSVRLPELQTDFNKQRYSKGKHTLMRMLNTESIPS